MNNFIVIGSKGYKNLRLDNIIDSFPDNMRCNIALPNNNNGTLPKKQMLCIHLYDHLIGEHDIKKEIASLKICNQENKIQSFLDYHRTGKLQYYRQSNMNYDPFFKSIGCPFSVNANNKVASCGLTAILETIKSKIKPFVTGFGLSLDDRLSYYNNNNPLLQNSKETTRQWARAHCVPVEINVIIWLHKSNFIDATMCSLEDREIPTFNCKLLTPTSFIINLFLKQYGICILENFYTEEMLNKFVEEFHRVFKEKKDKIKSILADNEFSGDDRIFNVEQESNYIKEHFSNHHLFNVIAQQHIQTRMNKKTLINKVKYNADIIANSGGGWHRDNHDMQFKTIMYLSDVLENNGCFQFITNSSKKYVGFPEHRINDAAKRNTRYTDKTIEDLLIKNSTCKINNIIGKKGTIIIVDTTYIHRGKNIEEGERYAMTQYYI